MAERRRMIAISLATLVVAAGLFTASWLLLGDDDAARPTGKSDYELVAVARRTLTIRSHHDGELGFGEPVTMPVRADGTLTWLPPTGTIVHRGQVLMRVDDQPVLLMYGETPAFRDLYDRRRQSSKRSAIQPLSGTDVRQLEANLAALQFSGFTVDDVFTAGTASAIKALQESVGSPPTGRLRFGQVLFQPGPIRVVTNNRALGNPVTPDAVRRTARAQQVTLTGPGSELSWAGLGARARVRLSSQRTVPARVIDVTAHEGRGEDGGNQLLVRLRLLREPAAGSSGPVTISHVRRKASDVLAVPVTALLALAEGGYGVQLADGTFVPVVPGLFADGFVEVSGNLPPNSQVRVPK